MKLEKIYEEPHADFFPNYLFGEPWATRLEDKAGWQLRSITLIFRDGGVGWYTDAAEQTKIAKIILERMLDGDFEENRDKTNLLLKGLLEKTKRMEKNDYSKKSSRQLVKGYSDYCEKLLELNSWGTLITLMEMGKESIVTATAFAMLESRGKAVGAEEQVAEAVGILCAPVKGTYMREKKIGEIEAAIMGKRLGLRHRKVRAEIERLHRNYSWVSYGYNGPEMGYGVFESEVRHFEGMSDKALGRELKNATQEDKNTTQKQKALEKFFKIDSQGKRLLEIARTFSWQKEIRKQICYRSFHALMPLRREIAKRAGVSIKQLGYLRHTELPLLLAGKFDAEILNERMKLLVYFPYSGLKMLTGKAAEKFMKQNVGEAAVDLEQRELKGQPAFSGGLVKGTVKIILNAHDMKKLKEGDILVSPATSPVMVPAMKKAGAIVTDQGGLTCHAAIVSRELRKACVIGTKFATKVLKDGDFVEVDSISGVVRKLTR